MRKQKNIFENLDWVTVSIYFVLVIFGWLNIYAANYNEEHGSIFDMHENYGKQVIWIGLSFLIIVAVLVIDGKFYEPVSYPLYAIILLVCIATIFLTRGVKGAHAWIEIGNFKLQPAEFMKLATAMALAKYLSSPYTRIEDDRTKVLSGLFLGIPMLIVLLQNDTGSALVFVSFIFVLYREGLSQNFLIFGFLTAILFVLSLMVAKILLIILIWSIIVLVYFMLRRNIKNLIVLIIIGAIGTGIVFSVDYIYNHALQAHQKERIDVLLGKRTDPKGAEYNVKQSLIAIGSGGIAGKGFLQGTQTKYDFVPEQSTDFIFCTVGEEWGFAGSATVLLLFLVLLYRILFIAERQKSKYTRVYAYGVASIIFFHIFINIGMAIGLLPVIGIPLPFFSYGGSSLFSFTILLFVLVKLDSYRMYVLR